MISDTTKASKKPPYVLIFLSTLQIYTKVAISCNFCKNSVEKTYLTFIF